MEGDLSEGSLESVSLNNSSPSETAYGIATAIADPYKPFTRASSTGQQNFNSSHAFQSGGNMKGAVSSGMHPSFSAPSSLNNSAVPPEGNDGMKGLSASSFSHGKMDNFKSWSISTYKCTRQLISEKLGKSVRTVDTELEGRIETLKETQKKYQQILRLARALSSHFYHVVQTQQQLGDTFADLAQKSPELSEEFIYNAETQRALSKNGETLMSALNFFVSSINTLCNKTIEDTLLTIKLYEQTRLEFDAYRTDLENLTQQPRAEISSIKIEEAQRTYNLHKIQYDKLRADVDIKLKFLNENKVKVMHKQLLLFHNAISAYFSGNQVALEATLKQFNIKLKSPSTSPSWLEQAVPETFQSIFGTSNH